MGVTDWFGTGIRLDDPQIRLTIFPPVLVRWVLKPRSQEKDPRQTDSQKETAPVVGRLLARQNTDERATAHTQSRSRRQPLIRMRNHAGENVFVAADDKIEGRGDAGFEVRMRIAWQKPVGPPAEALM